MPITITVPRLLTAKILSNVVLPKTILTKIKIPVIAQAIKPAKNIISYPLTKLLCCPFHLFEHHFQNQNLMHVPQKHPSAFLL